MMSVSPFLTVFALLQTLRIGAAVSCYTCNERIPNVDVCRNATRSDCNTVFPQQDSVCMKTVQRFSSGAPSWVFAQCQLRSAFTTEQINACQTTRVQQANNQTDELVTCTCTQDFCNQAAQLCQRGMYRVVIAIAVVLLPVFILADHKALTL